MRHKVYGRHLSRTHNERIALFRNLVRSLILHESINTTEAKAKAIKGLVDKLVTQAKSPNTQRLVSQFLVEKEVAQKLVDNIAPRLKDRNSGYTSIVKMGKRLGDGTMMVQMSLLTTAAKESVKPAAAKKIEKIEEKSFDSAQDVKIAEVKKPVKKTAPKTKKKVKA